jgi:hypothetical protein
VIINLQYIEMHRIQLSSLDFSIDEELLERSKVNKVKFSFNEIAIALQPVESIKFAES